MKKIIKRPIIFIRTSQEAWDVQDGRLNTPVPPNKRGCYFMIVKKYNDNRVLLETGAFGNRFNIDIGFENGQYRFKTSHQALSCCRKWALNEPVRLLRESFSYFNPLTGETTDNRKKAMSWFQGQRPLCLPATGNRVAGVWIEPGTDYVTIYWFYMEKRHLTWTPLQPEEEEVDEKGQYKIVPASIRLYNTGEVSHFFKGRWGGYCSRTYCTKRQAYKSWDPRFNHIHGSLPYQMFDLRARSPLKRNVLSEESKRILAKCGFPKNINRDREEWLFISELLNFAKRPNVNVMSRFNQGVDLFLQDIPFDEQHMVVPYKKGIIIRTPMVIEKYKNETGVHKRILPLTREPKLGYEETLLSREVGEYDRIYLSKDLSKHSQQYFNYILQKWENQRWDNIQFPNIQQEEMVSQLYSQIWEQQFLLSRLRDLPFFTEHPEARTGRGLYTLLTCLMKAPLVVETLLKMGHSQLIYCQECGFNLDYLARNFYLPTKSLYGKGKNFYQKLGVTKAQFNWLLARETEHEYFINNFMVNFRSPLSIPIPGKRGEYYQCFSDIPISILETLYQVAERKSHFPAFGDMKYFFRMGGTIAQIRAIYKNQLDWQLLLDYLRLRKTYEHFVRDVGAEAVWPTVPQNAALLQQYHDRLIQLVNLLRMEANSQQAEKEKERLAILQTQYLKRLKTLRVLSDEEDDKFIVQVPSQLSELITEGQILHHCVGSFVESVAEGRDTIIFLRHKDSPSTPYATINLLPSDQGGGWVINQAHTSYNGELLDEDVAFLKRWGAKHKIDLKSIKKRYGRLVHH